MKITPRNKPERLNFTLLAIDSLLYLFLGFLLFFVGPLFVILFLHSGKGSRRKLSETESNIISNLYDSKEGIADVWINSGLIFGIIFAILMMFKKVRRLHLMAVVLDENKLILNYASMNGRTTMKEYLLKPNSIKINVTKSTDVSDPIIEILHVKSGNRLLSTKKSKYWEYKYDFKHLLELRDELKNGNFLKE